MALFIALLCSYLVGSIPFGVIVAGANGVDIFAVGSGNVGATNVWRNMGAKWGAIVFALDVLKGAVPTLVAVQVLGSTELGMLCGIASVLGHSVSPFLRFRGGRGVSTGLGVLLGSTPIVALGAFAVFLVVLAISRYVSLASLIAALAMVGFGWATGQSRWLMLAFSALALVVFVRHRDNIKRLIAGNERRFSFAKRRESPPDLDADRPEQDDVQEPATSQMEESMVKAGEQSGSDIRSD